MRRDEKRPASLLALLLALGSAQVAAQAPADAATTALARELFHRALTAGERGDWEQAAADYRRVLELRDTPQVEFNLAQALLESGHVVEASELLVRIRRSEAAPTAVREAAAPLLERAHEATARLTVTVQGEPSGAELRLDARALPEVAWGVAMPVDPGVHRLSALRGERVVASLEFEIEPGRERTLELRVPGAPLGAVAAAHTASASSPGDAGDLDAALRQRPEDHAASGGGSAWRSPWLWTAVGTLLAAGVVTAVVLSQDTGAPVLDGSFMPGRIEL